MKLSRLLLILVATVIAGCSAGGTSTGNPLVEVKFDTYLAPASAKITPMAIASLNMCFKRIRFKMQSESTSADPTADEDNIDLSLGEQSINPSGGVLATVRIPPGTYTRVELDLEDHCTSAQSLRITNGNGSFQTNSRITVKFDGTFHADNANEVLALSIENLVNALNSVSADNQIKNAAEGVSGSF